MSGKGRENNNISSLLQAITDCKLASSLVCTKAVFEIPPSEPRKRKILSFNFSKGDWTDCCV